MVRPVFTILALLALAPSQPLPLAGNKLALPASAPFDVLSARSDGSRATFKNSAGTLLLSIEITRAQAQTEANKKALTEALLAKLRKENKLLGAETLAPATPVADPKVFVKVIDTIKVEDRASSRVRAVRVLNGYAIELFAIATHPDDGKREGLLTEAEEQLLLKIEPAVASVPDAPTKPPELTKVPKANLAFVPPAGSLVTVNDTGGEGVIATFTVLNSPARLVIARVPITPVEGQITPALLNAASERAQDLADGALKLPSPVSDPQKVQDGRFLTRTRRTVGGGGEGAEARITDSRTRQMGAALVLVAMVAPADREKDTAKLADELALSIR